MTGFLDPSAPSASAEYARYLDGDLLGKLLTKSFMINCLGLAPSSVYTPIGRYGDAKLKYASPGVVVHDPGDGHVDIGIRHVTFEIKCARINIANRARGDRTENWAFSFLLRSPSKAPKNYDLLVAVGVLTLGLEDEHYWQHLDSTCDRLRAEGHPHAIDALPHEEAFLALCSFFIIPRTELATNYFRLHVPTVDASKYAKYRVWGHDRQRAKTVWANAIGALDGV